MCGITGLFDTRGTRPIDRAALARMNDAQFHRGPDEGALHVEPGLGLGHRRLSIIDIATGQQPLHSVDGSACLVFNGEIYNYRELMAELQGLGHRFATKSDSEVIVNAWQAWGEDCVKRLRGMFAFALWDRTRKTLFTTRDHRGRQCRSLLASANWRIVPRTDPRTLVFSLLRLANRLHRAIGMARSGRMDAGMWFSMWALVDQCLRARGQSPATAPCR